MSDSSANLSLPYLQPSQAQKHVTHNEALLILDALVQLSVESRTATAPPATPAEGERHIPATGATGAWAGQDAQIALWDGAAWQFFAPAAGWRAYVLDEGAELVWSGSDWRAAVSGTLSLEQLGVNASADATNRLAVSSAATLFNHAGAGHQLKLNKAAISATASLLYQSNWSGRAEMGLAGSDDFAIKVSADGATWQSALSIPAASARPEFAQGLSVDGPIMGSGVLGTVAQSGGMPSGALLETGETAAGRYSRFADGTQICISPELASGAITTTEGALYASATQSWSFPLPFSAAPVLSGEGGGLGIWPVTAGASTSSVDLRALSTQSNATGTTLRLIATGRWF